MWNHPVMGIDVQSVVDYEPASTVDFDEASIEDRDGVAIHDLTYSSPGHGHVTAYWIVPRQQPRVAALIYVHPGPGNRMNFLDEALLLARGAPAAASLLIEAPWAQAEAWGRTMGEPEHDREEHCRTAIDLRRAVDLVSTRPEVDTRRIGYVGHSFGAMFGGILAGVERRLSAFALMSGVGSFADVAAVNIPTLQGKALHEYRRGVAAIDPINFIDRAAPAPLLFQLARQDMFPHETLLAYAAAGSEPKRITWYDADHYSINAAGRDDRMKWLHAKVSPISHP
jgi:cephalosporin-C deacetylase-like acetyl esterase